MSVLLPFWTVTRVDVTSVLFESTVKPPSMLDSRLVEGLTSGCTVCVADSFLISCVELNSVVP